jgi:cyanophycin synthetase
VAEGDAAVTALERAYAHDRAGREAEAIPEYEEALRRGLEPGAEASALLGLGSSLRNVGRVEEAVAVLDDACARHPDHEALRLFRALALSSSGRCPEGLAEALRVAVGLAADGTSVDRYRRALMEYADQLAAP